MNQWPKRHYPSMRRCTKKRKAAIAKAASSWGKTLPQQKPLSAKEYWAIQKWLKETDAKLITLLAINYDWKPRHIFKVYFPGDYTAMPKAER